MFLASPFHTDGRRTWPRAVSGREIRYIALRLQFKAIHRGSCRDVKGAVLLVAPGQVCGLFRHGNRPEVISVCIPDPDALGSSDKEIAAFIYLDAVGNAIVLCSRLLAENAAVTECAV